MLNSLQGDICLRFLLYASVSQKFPRHGQCQNPWCRVLVFTDLFVFSYLFITQWDLAFRWGCSLFHARIQTRVTKYRWKSTNCNLQTRDASALLTSLNQNLAKSRHHEICAFCRRSCTTAALYFCFPRTKHQAAATPRRKNHRNQHHQPSQSWRCCWALFLQLSSSFDSCGFSFGTTSSEQQNTSIKTIVLSDQEVKHNRDTSYFKYFSQKPLSIKTRWK